DFKNDDVLAARALDTALRRYGADAPRLDLARAHADRAELAVAPGDHTQADASRVELTALALTEPEKQLLTAEFTALEQIEDWMRG
ncbi:glyoxalase, partial [Mycobacterium sp. ITM-2017-0098]